MSAVRTPGREDGHTRVEQDRTRRLVTETKASFKTTELAKSGSHQPYDEERS